MNKLGATGRIVALKTHEPQQTTARTNVGRSSTLRDVGAALAFSVSVASAGFAYLSWADAIDQGRKADRWQAEASEHRVETLRGVRNLVELAKGARREIERHPEQTGKILGRLVQEQEEVGRWLIERTDHSQRTVEMRPAAPTSYRPLDPRRIHPNAPN